MLIRERTRRDRTSLLSCLPWDRRRKRREEWRKGGGGGAEEQWGVWGQTQGSGTALHPHPRLHPLSSDHSHRYKRIHFSWVFPWQGGERDRPEGWRRRGKKDGGLALKEGSDHHYKGAIVLYLYRCFLMRAPEGGGQVGTETGKWVVVVVLRYAGSQWCMTITPTQKENLLVNTLDMKGEAMLGCVTNDLLP